MTSKNLPAEQITITKQVLLVLSALVLSLPLAAQTPEKPSQKPPEKDSDQPSCTTELLSGWSHDLSSYLKKPEFAKTKKLATLLCRTSPEGPTPCPINISEETVTDIEATGMKTPEIIPVVACALKVSQGAISQELNEFLAQLLDKYRESFLNHWQMIPKEVKNISPKIIDFATVTSGGEDFSDKSGLLEKRLQTLEKAPASMKAEVAEAVGVLREEVKEAKAAGASNNDGEITFRTSRFHKQITDRLIQAKGLDPEHVSTAANEVVLNEGLNYKAYLKGNSNNWNICSASVGVEGSCHSASVNFETGKDSCGSYAVLGVLAQAGQTWVLMSGSSNYRISIPDILVPQTVTLGHEDDVSHSWNVPQGFTPEYLSTDLRMIYFKTIIKSDADKILGTLYLAITDKGNYRFLEFPKDVSRLTKINGTPTQTVKGLDGGSLQLRLPKICP